MSTKVKKNEFVPKDFPVNREPILIAFRCLAVFFFDVTTSLTACAVRY